MGGVALAARDCDRAKEDLEIWRRGALLPRPRRPFVGSGYTGCMEHLLKCPSESLNIALERRYVNTGHAKEVDGSCLWTGGKDYS